MLQYILQSGLTILLFYIVYQIFFSKEKSYNFNRFFLLLGMVTSLIIPFLEIKIETQLPIQNYLVINYLNVSNNSEQLTLIKNNFNLMYVYLCIYIIIFTITFYLYLKNIVYLFKLKTNNSKIKLNNQTIVLVQEDYAPFTFLNTIFINKEKYENNQINSEILTHETAHIRFKHSWDILIVELVKCVYWFNPIWYWYKKSIQLNHEFQADAYVLSKHHNITEYQTVLLQKTNFINYNLTSSFNYLSIKKRFIMMTKNKNLVSLVIKQMLVLPLFILLIVGLNLRINAQEEKTIIQDSIKVSDPVEQKMTKEYYYSKSTFILKDKSGNILPERTYYKLTNEEKAMLLDPPSPPSKIVITQENLDKFSDNNYCAIWIDNKVQENNDLKDLNPEDFDYFIDSFVHKNARSKKFPQEHQVSLFSKSGFLNLLEELNKPSGGTISNFYKKQ